jgi:signal transduction histidine kinase
LLFGLVVTPFTVTASAASEQQQKRVLVVYSTAREAALATIGDRELPRLLTRGLREGLDYHAEYIDAGRFADPEYQTGFRDFLRLKYRAHKFDAIIAILDIATGFMTTYRDELFGNTPLVFFARDPIAHRIPNSTGVIAQTDLSKTIDLALALQPEIDQVFVVSGAAARDKAFEHRARAQLRPFEPTLTFTYFSGLPTEKLLRRVSALPERSVIYYLLVYQDGDGQNFQPIEYLDRIAAVANRPIYSWVDSVLGRGVVGGAMQQLESQIAATADVALRVLQGQPADDMAVTTLDASLAQVDWRQAQRWGISQSRIPAGTVVRYRETSAWEQYSSYILAAGVIVIAQAALICGLLVQAAKRRRAEGEVARSHDVLRNSSERIRDLSRRLLTAQDEERSRIAHELHDDLGQRIARLSMDLQLLGDAGRYCDSERASLVREAQNRTGDIAQRVHDLSHRLHPEKLRVIGLVPALESLQRDVKSNIDLHFSHTNVPSGLPGNLTVSMFRVAQEALSNILKHSGARTGSMSLLGHDSSLSLIIADAGSGFEIASAWGKGFGLMSIRERVESVGGTLTITSQPGGGTRLAITVPLHASAGDGAIVPQRGNDQGG